MERCVWVVHYDNYGDRWLQGIYDSEDKVKDFVCPAGTAEWQWDYKVSKERLL